MAYISYYKFYMIVTIEHDRKGCSLLLTIIS